MNLRNPTWTAVLAIVAILGCAATASADGADELGTSTRQQVIAESLFHEGHDLIEAGKVAEACRKFAESQRLDPSPGTLLNLAACHETEGKTATAWAEFTEVETTTRRLGQTARATYARDHAYALRAVLSRIILSPPVDKGAIQVALDSVPLDAALLLTGIPVDPGAHLIVARMQGAVWQRTVQVPPGPVILTIPLFEEEAPTPLPPPAAPAAPVAEEKRSIVPGIVVGGLGIVAIGVGSYFGVHALALKSDGDALCNAATNVCTQTGIDDHGQARTAAAIADVTMGVGAAAVVTGVVMAIVAGGHKRATTGIRVGPEMIANGGGIVAGGSW